jgi:hypothetical protein
MIRMVISMKLLKKHLVLCTLSAVGFLIIIFGFFQGPLLPYPDPTKVLIEKYNVDLKKSEIIMRFGLIIIVLSLSTLVLLESVKSIKKRLRNR